MSANEGWTIQEAAEAAGCSERTCYRWLARFDAGEPMTDRSIDKLRRLRWTLRENADERHLKAVGIGWPLRGADLYLELVHRTRQHWGWTHHWFTLVSNEQAGGQGRVRFAVIGCRWSRFGSRLEQVGDSWGQCSPAQQGSSSSETDGISDLCEDSSCFL